MIRYLTIVLYTFIAAIILSTILYLPTSPLEYSNRPEIKHPTTQEIVFPELIDETISYGIFKPHMQSSNELKGLHESFGAGACVLDYNNDGWMDLFLINGSGQRHYYGAPEWWQSNTPYTLYENTGLDSFEDVTSTSLGTQITAWGMGCAAADLDNDGDQDLILSNYGANLLLENKGNGTFEDSTAQSRIEGDEWSTSILTSDFNNDGLLDLYILNYIKYAQGLKTYEASSGYSPESRVQFNASLFDSSPNKLYINKGNLVFEDQTRTSGLENFSGKGISAQALDINKDDYPDIFIANGQGTANKLFLNNKDLSFSDVSEDYKISSIQESTGTKIADINNDGQFDLLVGTDNKNSKLLYTVDNDSFFTDIAKSSGLDKTETSGTMTWGVSVSDLNNDGYPDVFLANGFTNPDLIAPRKPQGQANSILLNAFSEFHSCDSKCVDSIGQKARESSRSVIPVDIDNDGDKDIFLTQNNALGQLLINATQKGNWLGIKLQGSQSNRDAHGAVLSVKTKTRSFTKIINRSGFLSSQDKRLIFHLGNETADSLSIKWPSAKLQQFASLPNNRYLTITENFDTFTDSISSVQTRPTSRIIFSDNLKKIEAINWLGSAQRKKEVDIEVKLILDSKPSGTELIHLLKIANSLNPQSALKINVHGLKSKNSSTRLLALKNLKLAEEEISSRFLLSLFDDPSPRIRCEISNSYEHFFREEEAMLHSKYLAIPDLIHALSDTDENVVICAINALAESETHRAVQPLMALITMPDQKNTVRAKAIEALGHLREGKSAKLLFSILHDTKESSQCRYLSMGALKRLNAIDENRFFKENLVAYYKNRLEFAGFLTVLLDLTKDPDLNVIINPKALQTSLLNFKNSHTQSLSASEKNLIDRIIDSSQNTKIILATGGKASFGDDRPLSAGEIKKMQSRLADASESMETRTDILDDSRIKRLFSTQKLARAIAANEQDPLHELATLFLIERSSPKELAVYKAQLQDSSIPENRRFLIAKGLYQKIPEFVIKNILQ